VCGLLVSVGGGVAQTLPESRPNDLLAVAPATFHDWLQRARPAPVSAEQRLRILSALPRDGEVTTPDPAATLNLAGLRRVLRATHRDSVYVVKIIDVPQAAVGLHARTVLLFSEAALTVLSSPEVEALAAHEIGHEYVWAEYESAIRLGDRDRTKELELMCDAIAIATLHRLGLDPSRLMSGLEKISRFNRDRFGTGRNERNYPTLAERRAFARKVRDWLSRAVAAPIAAAPTDSPATAAGPPPR
jgi:hypothetical protein